MLYIYIYIYIYIYVHVHISKERERGEVKRKLMACREACVEMYVLVRNDVCMLTSCV